MRKDKTLNFQYTIKAKGRGKKEKKKDSSQGKGATRVSEWGGKKIYLI